MSLGIFLTNKLIRFISRGPLLLWKNAVHTHTCITVCITSSHKDTSTSLHYSHRFVLHVLEYNWRKTRLWNAHSSQYYQPMYFFLHFTIFYIQQKNLGPILHPVQFTFYTDACIVASCTRYATTLAPGEACQWKAEACSGANYTLRYFSDLKNAPMQLSYWQFLV